MYRAFGFFVALAVVYGVVVGLGRVPEALAHVELFRVSDFRVEGNRYLPDGEAVAASGIPMTANVWDDLEPYATKLRRHPLVHEAKVKRRLPGTLVLQVSERRPVALLPTPALVPVDAQGQVLPIDPALHRLDLPLIQPFPPGRTQAGLTPAQIRSLAAEMGRLTETEPAFMTRISEVAYDSRGDIVVRLADLDVELHFTAPLAPRRLLEGLAALTDAAGRRPDVTVEAIDLRYADQVVVRFSPNGRT